MLAGMHFITELQKIGRPSGWELTR